MLNYSDDFLDRPFSCDNNDTLQNALRQRTTRLLGRKRRLRYLAVAGLAAACYLAGVATMWFTQQRSAPLSDAPAPMIVANQKTPPAVNPPEIIDKEALAKAAERAAVLWKAGDLYLAEKQDYASAVHCYSEALRLGGADALKSGPDDNWLVLAMKLARRSETRAVGSEDNWVALHEFTKRREKFNE